MAFASWWYKTHVNEKSSGSSSKQGEKKGSDEKKASNLGSSHPSRAHASGAASDTKVSTSSGATAKTSSMNTTESQASSKQMEGLHPPHKKRHKKQAAKTQPDKSQSPEKSQSTKPSVVHEKKSQEGKPKEHTEPKSLPKHVPDAGSKQAHKEKAVSKANEKLTSEKSTEPKVKSQDHVSAGGETIVAGVSAVPVKADDKKKEKKSLTPEVPVNSKPDKPGKSGLDAALDDLIDTLGEPEETNENNTPYTGPVVSDPMFSTNIEELGKREVTIPPKYRELLAKKEGITGPPPDSPKSMGPDDAIDALSSDFTCSSPTTEGKKTESEKSTGEVLKAQSAGVVRSTAPPQEKKRRVEEDAMSDQALEALSASLGTRKSDPEIDLSSIKEVDEAKAKEEKLEKCGEDDETVPSEYRLKPVTDEDGKPLLPEPEEKSKPRSESELIDELAEDFDQSKSKEKQSEPTEKTEKSKVTAPVPVAEPVSRTSMCSIQSTPPKTTSLEDMAPNDAVEALAGSLGKRQADPEDAKPEVDKVKEKAKEEDREKLGEKEETVPPDYRLEEVKDKDGKPFLPKDPKKQFLALSDDFLVNALSEDFYGSPDASSLKLDDAKLSAVMSEVVSQTQAPTTQTAAPPPNTRQRDKELDDALDKLSDSLGQRKPDPDANKPMEDKVKEKAKAEHRDKLGERDDTIPPDYRHLLDNDGQDKPASPATKKSKKPEDDQDPIDALSGDLDSCPTPEPSQNTAKDKTKKTASSSKTPKNGGKAKDSTQRTKEVSKPDGEGKTS
ncbi:calpastatin isoform X2 [Dipodomys merriami]|uniref:calpastatin isoform X2 n=1 Tax=Dipodomys merriami TaxID=94247 RepID=UPI003855810A